MAQFKFKYDEKNTIWYSKEFYVEADSLEEAKAEVIQKFNNPNIDIIDHYEGRFEIDYNTTEYMLPEENDNQATKEVLSMEDGIGIAICDNGKRKEY
jgi:hypothetical protein